MLSYPARIARDGERFMVSFPDIPEALTGAATREEALALAVDALTTAMDFYFEDRRQVPAPSAPKRGQTHERASAGSQSPYRSASSNQDRHDLVGPACHRQTARVEPCLTALLITFRSSITRVGLDRKLPPPR